jgi:diguanylate cyclase (GGDEF)-like protein
MEVAEELRRTVTGALLSHAEAQLALLSAYDPLTTLANRRTLKLTMDRVAADPAHKVAAMLFLDLDRFKAINDVLGHSAGDQVLIEVAARLRRLTPEGALAGRLGGDEFVIFWPGAGKSEAERLAQQLMSAMGKPFVLSDQTLHVSGSIGISWSDFGGLDRLMPQADEAMYAAKRHGGGGVAMFHPVFHAEALNNLRLEQDLFRALNDDEITVHYQPIFRASDRSLLGFEALARWLHPERGWISPVDFIPVAEKSGLITRLGERVMTCAVRQISEWLRIDATLRMTVNVSGLQLVDRGLGDMLSNLLQLEAVPPERVCVEVTETVLMKESALDQLHRLREMGVGIAMDDFGTGYSSIAYLEDLPVDLVKIDRRFVEPLGSSARADGVFQAIVSLARTLGLSLIAEGCETEDQLRVIRESGCDGVQGWLLGKAAPPEEVAERLLGDRKGD